MGVEIQNPNRMVSLINLIRVGRNWDGTALNSLWLLGSYFKNFWKTEGCMDTLQTMMENYTPHSRGWSCILLRICDAFSLKILQDFWQNRYLQIPILLICNVPLSPLKVSIIWTISKENYLNLLTGPEQPN
jgi:hypothetical protein